MNVPSAGMHMHKTSRGGRVIILVIRLGYVLMCTWVSGYARA